MSKEINIDHLFGTKKDNYTILSFAKKDKYYNTWINVICDCGNKYIKSKDEILNRKSIRCIKCPRITLMGNCPEYTNWRAMRSRCYSKSAGSYYLYGGRGIKICTRWDKFSNFLEDMGPKPDKSYSLDRIDNEGNYEPSNCRWATKKEQIANRRYSTDKKNIYFSGLIKRNEMCSICTCDKCIKNRGNI